MVTDRALYLTWAVELVYVTDARDMSGTKTY
jgi:hypothetical protein